MKRHIYIIENFTTIRKHTQILVIIFLPILFSCTEQLDKERLKNGRLFYVVDSLQRELNKYHRSPIKLYAEASNSYKSKDTIKLKLIRDTLLKYHPESIEKLIVDSLYLGAVNQKKLENDEIVAHYQKLYAEKEKARRDKEKRIAKYQEAEERKIKKQEQIERNRKQAVLKRLEKKHDDISGTTWYTQPYFKHYNDMTATSVGIGQSNRGIWMVLKMSYQGEKWIFFENAYLSYDGNTKQINFSEYDDKKTEFVGGDGVWEWIQVAVDRDLMNFINDCAYGKSIKMRLSGKYSITKVLSVDERKGLKDIVEAFKILSEDNNVLTR